MARERTLILVKPDGVQRGLVGAILKRFEKRGYKAVAMKVVQPTVDFAKQHYADLSSMPFYGGLCQFLASGPVVAMVIEGASAIVAGRAMMGETAPANSKPGSIRGDYCSELARNVIHGSDSPASAQKEINLWFKPTEILSYTQAAEVYVYDMPVPAPTAAAAPASPMDTAPAQ